MKNKVMLVLLAIVLVVSLVAFGACTAPAERLAPTERVVPTEERVVPPEEEKTPTEKVVPPEEEKCNITISPLTATRMVGETLELEVIVTREVGRGVGEPVLDINCVLFDEPPGTVYQEGETDANGEYVFEVVGTEAGTFAYTVTAPGYPNLTATAAVTWVEAVIEVVFRNVESEPSVILELKKGDDVVLQVMETLLVEPTLTYYTAMWTPDLGQYYWYGYAEWNKELPQYTFGFAMTAAAAPDITNHNTSRSNKDAGVIVVSPDGDIDWNNKETYLGLMKKLGEAIEEIGSREDIVPLLEKEVPSSASELIAEQERLLDKVNSSDYDKALVQLAKNLPYQGTEVSNPGDVTYEELERVVSAIEASVIIIGTAADLARHNPIGGACLVAVPQNESYRHMEQIGLVCE